MTAREIEVKAYINTSDRDVFCYSDQKRSELAWLGVSDLHAYEPSLLRNHVVYGCRSEKPNRFPFRRWKRPHAEKALVFAGSDALFSTSYDVSLSGEDRAHVSSTCVIEDFLWQSWQKYRHAIAGALHLKPHRATSGDPQYLHLRRAPSTTSAPSLAVRRRGASTSLALDCGDGARTHQPR
jgi:hypothetical protein